MGIEHQGPPPGETGVEKTGENLVDSNQAFNDYLKDSGFNFLRRRKLKTRLGEAIDDDFQRLASTLVGVEKEGDALLRGGARNLRDFGEAVGAMEARDLLASRGKKMSQEVKGELEGKIAAREGRLAEQLAEKEGIVGELSPSLFNKESIKGLFVSGLTGEKTISDEDRRQLWDLLNGLVGEDMPSSMESEGGETMERQVSAFELLFPNTTSLRGEIEGKVSRKRAKLFGRKFRK